jgi:hypothetical protein
MSVEMDLQIATCTATVCGSTITSAYYIHTVCTMHYALHTRGRSDAAAMTAVLDTQCDTLLVCTTLVRQKWPGRPHVNRIEHFSVLRSRHDAIMS